MHEATESSPGTFLRVTFWYFLMRINPSLSKPEKEEGNIHLVDEIFILEVTKKRGEEAQDTALTTENSRIPQRWESSDQEICP